MIGAVLAARRGLAALPPDPQGRPDLLRPLPWHLRALPVCATTEVELERWLAACPALVAGGPLPAPLAVLARRQRFGRGQRGRHWSSPAGGAWISAALPWPQDPAAAAAPGLAVAVGLALELEELGLTVRLKWPNDLLLIGADGQPRKLAGLLPRLRLRGGQVRWARLGVGLNGINRVPAGAVALAERIGPWAASPERLVPLVLRALSAACGQADQAEAVRQAAEALLWCPPGPVWHQGLAWRPLGLDRGGGLRLGRDGAVSVLERVF